MHLALVPGDLKSNEFLRTIGCNKQSHVKMKEHTFVEADPSSAIADEVIVLFLEFICHATVGSSCHTQKNEQQIRVGLHSALVLPHLPKASCYLIV